MTIHRAADLPAEREAIRDFLIGVFKPGPDEVYDETDYYVRAWDGDRWVSLVEIVDRTITVGGAPVRVAGIGGVSTRPEMRRRGFSAAALREAARFFLDNLNIPLGMLFCGESMIPFYQRLGWRLVRETFTYIWKRNEPPISEPYFMVLEAPGAVWPPGPVDLNGPSW
jgi:aminoglycoside 2'-N-acetyltransferase I